MPKDNNAAVRARRLSDEEIARNFRDMHPPLGRSEALIEADRCYFCFDAPCTTACPTGIDIPGFIQKIRSDNLVGSAHTKTTISASKPCSGIRKMPGDELRECGRGAFAWRPRKPTSSEKK